jgi:dihydrofolate synthase/folylpolyglutamate synthase
MNFKSGLAVVFPMAAERQACLAGVSRQGRFQEGAGFGYHGPMAENRDLTQALARLDALTDWERRPRNTMRVGLEPMRDLATRLGDPQKSFRAIHVAGTKGKGSVSALIEAALAHARLRVGRYASPHVERITERVSVQGRDVDEPTLAHALDTALDAYEAARKAGTPAANATWFDLLTAAAFLIFREAAVEWAVIEVGLGGRLDSTNIVDGEIAVVTNIALEHTEILGHTRSAIAGEKVGILKPGAVLVTSLDADDEAGRVVQTRADELGSRVKRTRLDASAPIDQINLALAAAVLGELRRKGVSGRSGEPVGATLLDGETRAAARLPGRMERFDVEVGPGPLPVVMDGAHVPFNIGAVLRDLALTTDLSGPCVAIVALAADKDAAGFVGELAGRASTVIFTDLPGSSRGRSPGELKALAESLGLVSEVEPDAKRALKRGLALARQANAWLLVTGSLYLVGALRPAIGEAASTPASVRGRGRSG